MTRVFGNSVEPGGMLLDNNQDEVDCPACGKPARWRDWEACDGGSINSHYSIRCSHCGYYECDDFADGY